MSTRTIRNMEEFAEVSGLSRPTISKYFNDPDSVRASTREKIEAAIETWNYRPNIYAVNQNRRLTKNIGVVVPYLADPFFAEIARNIETLVIASGFRPILLSSHGDPEQEIGNLDSLRSIKPAGVLLAPLGRASDRARIEAFCDVVPTIHFDSNIKSLGDGFVGHDNLQATSVMVDYLCRSGEAPVFFEMRNPTNPNANRRRNAYVETMERLGQRPEILKIDGEGWNFEDIGFHGGLKAIGEGQFATNTVLCSNDRLAIGLLAAAYESGLRVGLGSGCALRVAGHDDHPFSRFTCPRLTTVAQNYAAIAQRSVEMLLALIDKGKQPGERPEILFEGKLVLRASA